jgi:Ca2+/Na+ antiporter
VVRLSPTRRAQLVLALALAFVGAVCAVYGAGRMSEETKIMPTGLIGAAAIGPLLVLPMIGSASHLAAHGNAQTATGASVVIVLLNVCLLLPVVIAGWHVREHFVPPVAEAVAPAPPPAATTAPATTQSVADDEFGEDEPVVIADDFPRVLTFPVAVWRIDAVLLILLGLMLLPVSLNLWDMRRTEGFLLIVIYACYLIATTFLGRRW